MAGGKKSVRIARELPGEGFQRPPGWHGGVLFPGGLPSANAPSSARGLHTRQFNVMVSNLREVLAHATEEEQRAGVDWYPSGHDHARRIGRLAGASTDEEAVRVGAGVIAPLSAGVEWNRNLVDAHHMATHGVPLHPQYSAAESKARAVLEGADPDETVIKPGRPKVKVWNFYHNLRDPQSPEYVTMDRHAHDALTGAVLTGEERGLDQIGRYNRLSQPYRMLAEERGEIPNVTQATAWVTYKRLKGDRAAGHDFEGYLKSTGQYDDYMSL